jgi:RNA recognition motif-containing protein
LNPDLFNLNTRKVLIRLQVRYADGELERLGIVNLAAQTPSTPSAPGGAIPQAVEQCSKLYVCHLAKDRTFEDINRVFSTAGDIEELYLFKDGAHNDDFKGSCFIKYSTRKEALRAIYKFNQRGREESGPLGKLVEAG